MASGKRAQDVTVTRSLASSAIRTLTSGPSAPPAVWDMWADASDTNLLGNAGIANGATPAIWKNKGTGGSAYDWTVHASPTLQRNYINGMTAVVGTASSYFKSAHSPFAAGAARTLIFVLVTPSADGSPLAVNDAVGYNLHWSSNIPEIEFGGGGAPAPSCSLLAAPTAGQICIVEWRFDGNAAHLPTLRLNGVDQAVVQTSGTGVGTETFTDSTYLQYLFQQGIGDFLGRQGLLASDATTLTRQWLNAKYNILQ
jgi:hypothetical protein